MKVAFFFISLLFFTQHTLADDKAIMVIANTQNADIQLTRQQVRNLFMGGVLSYDFVPIALPTDNQARVLFNTKVVGLTESRIQSYWAQMRFTGRKKPPLELQNERLVIEYVMNNQGAVCYLPADVPLPEGLTVLYTSH
ncbi:hypothetical protein RS130_05810 [Paraglaciecola aquimarina]|uniref:Uncharacterized protein n=1 Tax=Paraglaciecola aquimarina TaxID=1235557 RepID=A0ABU3SU32_9ALTE|nr:hypothetical protein [Paraglaciecola aquimarina]MDU0353507.1 hypothetical protein [Paraglaciecola aquimarina]